MIKSSTCVSLLATALLASGCGSGTDFLGFSTSGKTFAEADTEANALLNDISSGTATAELDMPSSGAATYRGATVLTLSNGGSPDIDLVGEATVQANFTATGGTVTGTLENFLADSGDPVTGSLAIENGTIGAVFANEFDADVNGGINVGSDSFIVAADSNGEFLETGATEVYGDVFGSTSGSRGAGTISGDYGGVR